MTESSRRNPQPLSKIPLRWPVHAIQDLSPAELAVALADVRDELRILARSRSRQLLRMASWATGGGFSLLYGALAGPAPLFFVAFLCFLRVALIGPSYQRNQARWRELRERLKSLQLARLHLPSPEP